MIEYCKSTSIQAGERTVIIELSIDIKNLEAEEHTNQAVFEYMVQEIKEKLEPRIREVKEWVKICPLLFYRPQI